LLVVELLNSNCPESKIMALGTVLLSLNRPTRVLISYKEIIRADLSAPEDLEVDSQGHHKYLGYLVEAAEQPYTLLQNGARLTFVGT
jgi:hypothetical protein